MILRPRFLASSLLLLVASSSTYAFAQEGPDSAVTDLAQDAASVALEESSLGETSADPPGQTPYFVIGHRRLLQQLHAGDRAWTLGDDGAVVAWVIRETGWVPQAIRQFPEARSLSLHGEDLQVTTPGFVERVRARDLKHVAQLPASHAVACGERLSWRIDAQHRLCAKSGAARSVCSADASNLTELLDPVCVIDDERELACLTVRSGSAGGRMGAASWCLDGENVLRFFEHTNPEAVAHPLPGRVDWLVRTFGGWQVEENASAVMNRHRQTTWGTPCYRAGVGPLEACSTQPALTGLKTSSVSAQRLQGVVTSDHALYFVFQDGWYAQGELVDVSDVAGVRQLRTYPDGDQRVWVEGDVYATGLYQGDAYVATCDPHREDLGHGQGEAQQWQLRVVNLDQGHSVIASQGEGRCPERVDFHEDVLRLSFESRAEEWSLATETLHDADIRSPFRGAISGDLVARAESARHCPTWGWNVSLESPTLGRVPLSARSCARSVASTRWASDGGRSHGPALIMSGISNSHVFMIDEDTLESFSLRTPGLLSPRTRIHRSKNGTWLLSDPQTGQAQRFSAKGDALASEQALIVGQRVWTQLGHGALRNEDGETALVTDAGLVLGDVGVGPIVIRTVRDSRSPVKADSSALRALAARWFTNRDE